MTVQETMPLYENPHHDHDQHLCEKIAHGITIGEYRKLVTSNPKWICRLCGRAARDAENLCDPVALF
ncbi:MAG: hypothetical protein ACFE7S_08610 [Candidatus Hodarchaeota archaeon]